MNKPLSRADQSRLNVAKVKQDRKEELEKYIAEQDATRAKELAKATLQATAELPELLAHCYKKIEEAEREAAYQVTIDFAERSNGWLSHIEMARLKVVHEALIADGYSVRQVCANEGSLSRSHVAKLEISWKPASE